MSNTISNIKNLREITGAGFLDCKKALLANDNDIESSIDYMHDRFVIFKRKGNIESDVNLKKGY